MEWIVFPDGREINTRMMEKFLGTGYFCAQELFYMDETKNTKIKGEMMMHQKQFRLIVVMALLVALSVVGSFIKIPSPTGTVALDALPGYLGALLLGGIPGAIVAFIGHLATAATTGFAMTLPIHLLVAIQMAVTMLVYGFLAKKTRLPIAMAAAILINGVGSPACFILIPNMGVPFFTAMVLPLTIGSAINVILSGLVYFPLQHAKVLRNIQG